MGVAIYSFEGVGMVLPLESEMKDKDKFGKVLALTMAFISLMYEIVERRFWGGTYCLWLRWLLVFFVSLVALSVPNFADFLSLVGSGVCCALGLVLPPLFHFLVFKDEMGWKGWSLDVGIGVLGIVLGVSGTWYALLEIFFANA
ncbi:hypothetical protein FH972_009803 [Carpinus fangiana]|uniref:Amino acid transporter transmembrane domain-containing protein n=1 Tax=Carpinus fangiana TaxID=176857 RepID=A0A660KLD4_9ROSI|nr:hypothetical protein FH972_009803 [Carpinus fangiana]